MMKLSWIATSAIACILALALEVIAFTGWMRPRTPAIAPAAQAQLVTPAALTLGDVQHLAVVAAAAAAEPVRQEDSYYAQLRSRIRWVETRIGNDKLLTPDDSSRVLLAKSAADRAGLKAVGLSFKDVYGIISAETSWIPRMGASKDGTPNLGLAQFEPATARALGLRNPDDPVEAIHVAALHMKEAAEWSANRIAGLKLGATERALKLREGVSIFYNLSTKGRNRWNGKNTAMLPIETQLHIRNARTGARFAAELDARHASPGFMVVGG
jgi:hypothetical protein